MICFEVYRNGKLLCTAGLSDFGMLLASVSRMAQHPGTLARFAEAGCPQPAGEALTLTVSGFIDAGRIGNESLQWAQERLAVGDEVRVRVVERPDCDPVQRHPAPEPAEVRRSNEELYRNLGRELGHDRTEPGAAPDGGGS
jgi:hypothetical protein